LLITQLVLLEESLITCSEMKKVKKMAKDVTDELIKLSNLKDNKENRDFIFSLVHHAIRGVAGVAHHAIGAVRGVAHHLLGDEDKQDFSKDLAMEITNALIKDNSEKAKKDFIFGLIHHAIRGVAGVAHHAIGAVRGIGHAILGDEQQKDFIFGLIHHAIRGVAGVAHHAIGAVRGLGHAILGDEELDAMANEVMDKLVKEGLKVDENKQDFIFGIIHHAIRGVAGVAHHAIGAVRGLGHAILGDEDKQDDYVHHVYGIRFYGDDIGDEQ